MKSCENFPEASEGQDTGPEACAETEETIPSNGEKVKGSLDITWVLGKATSEATSALDGSAVRAPKFLKLVWAFSWKERYILDEALVQQLANLCTVTPLLYVVVRTLWSGHLIRIPFDQSRLLACLRPSVFLTFPPSSHPHTPATSGALRFSLWPFPTSFL